LCRIIAIPNTNYRRLQYLVVFVQLRGPSEYSHPTDFVFLHVYHWISRMSVPLFQTWQAIPLSQTPVDHSGDFVMSVLIPQLCQLAAFSH